MNEEKNQNMPRGISSRARLVMTNHDFCDYTSKSKTGMKLHLKSSHGVIVSQTMVNNTIHIPKCLVCGEGFNNDHQLRDHIRHNHINVQF